MERPFLTLSRVVFAVRMYIFDNGRDATADEGPGRGTRGTRCLTYFDLYYCAAGGSEDTHVDISDDFSDRNFRPISPVIGR